MTLQNVKISLRTDVLSNWTSSDPILKDGELVVVNDISANITRFKVGNGVSSFSQLPFINQNKVITDHLEANNINTQHFSQGIHAQSTPYGLAAGAYLCSNAYFSQTFGYAAESILSDTYSFVWNGDDSRAIGDKYQSHGKGTFNLNALSGISGIYIGNQSLADTIDEKVDKKSSVIFVDWDEEE